MYARTRKLVFYIHCVILQVASASTVYNIGAILSSPEAEKSFKDAIHKVNTDYDNYGLGSARLNGTSYILNNNPLQATVDICDHLIPNGVYVVVTSKPMNSTETPAIVSFACGFYNIPVIGTQSRETELSDKTLHPLYLRTTPSYSDEARVIIGLLKYFKWNKVNLVMSDDYDGRLSFIKLTSLAYQNSINIEKPILFPTGSTDLRTYLKVLKETQSKVIIFGSSSQDAEVAYRDAKTLGISAKGYIWIVTERASSATVETKVPIGFLTFRLDYGNSLSRHVQDAVKVIAYTIGRIQSSTSLTPPPKSCDELSGQWKSGQILYKDLINTTHSNGLTGSVKFDWLGDRANPSYGIYNVQYKNATNTAYMKVGSFSSSGVVAVNQSYLVWPGNETQTPSGVFISSHLRIVTVEIKPFIITVPPPKSGVCADLDKIVNGKKQRHVHCNGPTIGRSGTKHCCKGYCIDLLIRLATRINFTYDLYLVADGHFGSLTRVNGSNIKRWNGVVADVVEGKADLVVTALTINNERAQYIEFSKPYKYQGITILVKKSQSKSNLDSFLRPFHTELWLLVLLSVHVVAVILYLLDRFSPFGRYKLAQADKEETPLDLSSAMWFSWGVLLNSGIGEGTPRSFSARVLAMVWAGFAMIIVASYTANLAAFLVLERPKPVVTGIDDPNMRNPTDSFKYGTVANSSVDAYFRRQVELSSMYTFMDKYNVATEQQGIAKVKNGELKAFIWDSPVLYHETSQDCSVATAGELFGRSGYGIAMPKGSPWSQKISLAILNFHESGVMEELESTWIDFGNCPRETKAPKTLGLNHMLGVFIMVAVGIGAGIVIVILEVLYYKHKGWRKEQRDIMKKATEQWQDRMAQKKHEKDSVSSFTKTNGTTENQINGHVAYQSNPVFEYEHTETNSSTNQSAPPVLPFGKKRF